MKYEEKAIIKDKVENRSVRVCTDNKNMCMVAAIQNHVEMFSSTLRRTNSSLGLTFTYLDSYKFRRI